MKKLLCCFLLGTCLSFSFATWAHPPQFKVLVFTKTDGFHHQAINEGVDALRAIAVRHHFTLDWEEDAKVFNDERLAQYQAVVFLMTTGNVLNEDQQAATERFIQAGNGFVGIHSASDTEYDWDWYTQMVGRTFHRHPHIQTAELQVLSREFPGVARMPERFLWTDEWYEFGQERIEGLNYILAVEDRPFEGSTKAGLATKKGKGSFRPMAWYHEYDGGRAFYTALGHMPSTYSDRLFLEHIYGGLYWAATGKGIKETNTFHFRKAG